MRAPSAIHMRNVSALSGLALLAVLASPVVGQSGSLSVLLSQADAAIDDGNIEQARVALSEALRIDDGEAEVHLLFARLYLTEGDRLAESDAALGRARRLAPDNAEYLELELRRLRRSSSGPLPGARAQQRIDLAHKILRQKDHSCIAHMVLGEEHAKEYLRDRRTVSFPALDALNVTANSEAYFNAAYLLEPRLSEGPADYEIDFMTRRRYGGVDVLSVSRDRRAHREREKALEHLRMALDDEFDSESAFRLLSLMLLMEDDYETLFETAGRRVDRDSAEAGAWMVFGMAQHALFRESEAAASFDRAFSLMPEDEAKRLRSSGMLLLQDHLLGPESGDLWELLDPRVLTPENERELEHYFRMMYADLRYGNLESGLSGWDTDPGQVIVRYGIPLAEAQSTSRFDRYFIFHYGDLWFKFMRLAKTGAPTFYSPKVGAGEPSFDAIDYAWEDYELISRDVFRKLPHRFVYDRGGTRVAFPAEVSAFRGSGGKTDLFVAFGVPRDADSQLRQIQTGIFVMTPRGKVAELRRSGHSGFAVRSDGRDFEVYGASLPVSPGHYVLSVEFAADDETGIGFQRVPADAPSLSGFSTSDLLLAYLAEQETESARSGDFNLHRNGVSLRAAPWGVFEVGQPIYAYFELYGLRPDGTGEYGYALEAVLAEDDLSDDAAVISRLFGTDNQAVSVRYAVESSSEVDAQYVILDTAAAGEGTYIVALRLTDRATGETATSHRNVVITGKE